MHIRQFQQFNTPKKLELQDKAKGWETNKVKKNISDCVAGNRTAVKIRARDVPIKRGREVRKIEVNKKEKKREKAKTCAI